MCDAGIMRLRWPKRSFLTGLVIALPLLAPSVQATEPVTLKVVGGLAGVRQFTRFEQPFWEREIEALSGGRIKATIHPFDRSGIRGQDMLQLMKMGVVPFGNALLALSASDTPQIQGVDLPGVNPDFEALRRNIETYRATLKTTLRDVYNVELLGVYSYPAQVLFCSRPFEGLHAIGGFKIRTSSIAQSDLVTALGAIPVITPFSEIVDAMHRKSVDCAITGIISGHEIGLTAVATHVHAQAITWGLSVFGANRVAWENLSADNRETIALGVRRLEEQIMRAAEEDTRQGFDCSRGLPNCTVPTAQRQVVVAPANGSGNVGAHIVRSTVLPQWVDRCGEPCEAIVAQGLIPAFAKVPEGALSASTSGGESD
jgi:TRAP-type C4-dicarboxylate transport system substrate-binding protein